MRKRLKSILVSLLTLSVWMGATPPFEPIVLEPVKAAEETDTEPEERTAYIPITYSLSSYPQGDDIEYKLTLSKKSYPASAVSFKQTGKGLLSFDVDVDVTVVLGGNLVTRRLQQLVLVDTDTGEFTIKDSSFIEDVKATMDKDTEINVYGESKVPEGKHEIDKDLYTKEMEPSAFNDLGGKEAINQMKMKFTDAITGQELETQLSTHMTLWQKNESTGLPILRTLQVIYLFSDIDTCQNSDYTEGTCPEKGEHTFIQTEDSYYFAVDEVTRTLYLEQGTQTKYKLKWVSKWSEWNHDENDRVWEDDYPKPNSTSLNQKVEQVVYGITPRIYKKLYLPDEEAPDAEANTVPITVSNSGWLDASDNSQNIIKVKENWGDWSKGDINLNFPAAIVNTQTNNWELSGGVWKSTNHSHNSTSSVSFEFTLEREAVFSFDWSVSSESTSYDYVYYTVTSNGSTVSGGTGTKIGGTGYGSSESSLTYLNVKNTYSAGKYTITFYYRKDGSVHSGLDTAFVKNLKAEYVETVPEINETDIDLLHSNNHAHSSSSSMTYEFDVTRTAILEFDWAVSSEKTGDTGMYTLTKNGSTVSGTGTSTKQSGIDSGNKIQDLIFTHTKHTLEPGSYKLTFTYSKNNAITDGFDALFVKNVEVKYEDAISGNMIGSGYYSGNHNDSSSSTLTYKFKTDRAATMSFDWAASSESVSYDYLQVTVNKDGSTIKTDKIGGSTQGTTLENLKFTNISQKLEPGTYTVTFVYRKDSSVSKYLDTGFVRGFSVLYDIVHKPERPDTIWTKAGTIWQSNNVTDGSENTLTYEFSIQNTGSLAFDYTVSSASGDTLSYSLTKDGTEIVGENASKISGTSRGTSVSNLSFIHKEHPLSSGTYKLIFNYKKDNNPTTAGLDKGFVKDLKIEEIREVVTVTPNTGDTSYLDEYPMNSLVLDQRDYKVYWQHIEEGEFLRSFAHDWTHKYIFQDTHEGGPGFVQESNHDAYGMTIQLAYYAKPLKDGNRKGGVQEYYLVNKTDNFNANRNYMGSGSWYNGEGKDNASTVNGNTVYNLDEKFNAFKKYCEYGYDESNGCRRMWYDSYYQTQAMNENGNLSCTHYHNTIRDNNNACASPNSCRTQSVNSCTNYVSNGYFKQPVNPDDRREYLREGSMQANTCSVYKNTGSYQTRTSCNGCETYKPSCTHCVETEWYWGTCTGSCDGGYTCGSKGTSCCSYEKYSCEKSRCARYEDYTNHCCSLYYEKTHYNTTSTSKKDGENCGWTFPTNTSTLYVLNTDSRAPSSAECGWIDTNLATSYKHCGYKTASSPTIRTYYFEVRRFTEHTSFISPTGGAYLINSSQVDKDTGRYSIRMTRERESGSSRYQYDTGWYQDNYEKNAKRNWENNEVREDELVDAEESWTDYVDADTWKEEWRTEYRWKSPLEFDEKYTLDEQEAIECATQTGRYAGPVGSCVILEQITVPKYVEQEVTEVIPGSRTSPAGKNITVAQVDARAELYAEGQYQLYVYQNMPTRNLAVNNTVNSTTGFVGQEISTIKLKEDYQDAYIALNNRKASLKATAKNTYMTTFEIWDIYMYIVGHSRYAATSTPANTMSGKTTVEIPFTFTVTNGGLGCGPGLTPPPKGCPFGTEIVVTSLLLSNEIANKGMNSLVYTDKTGNGNYGSLVNQNSEELTAALCRAPQNYYFTVKDYDDTDALVNMIIAEQHFNQIPKENSYVDNTFKVYDKYKDEVSIDELFDYLMNLEESDNSPAHQAIKQLEQTNIMKLLLEQKDLPEETFKEACSILNIDFASPTELLDYYNRMKNAGLTIEDINEQYNITITGTDFRTYIQQYRATHDNTDVYNRLAFIDNETQNLLNTFGTEGTIQNDRIKAIVTAMCNK